MKRKNVFAYVCVSACRCKKCGAAATSRLLHSKRMCLRVQEKYREQVRGRSIKS